jgi:hypothetical protein
MIMLFLSKLNLLQYNRKCSEHSFLYPHRKLYLLTFLLETDILVYCMLGLEINVVLWTAIYLNRSWCLVLLVHVDIRIYIHVEVHNVDNCQ